ncbi:hypothetical protein [Agriterribacter sp.]|uniref:hypothetical protein n=1 Tax=Agriterribacter sp. TaxID=2821509 RepID=UPI002C19C7AE|nr:hypothetical protein [Agriterribacter sp.]HRP57759.1 hypothetical protein [Agriterribacter sp.]
MKRQYFLLFASLFFLLLSAPRCTKDKLCLKNIVMKKWLPATPKSINLIYYLKQTVI